MTITTKIIIYLFIVLLATVVMVFFVFPKFQSNLTDLQNSHLDQLATYNKLTAEVTSLQSLQADLDAISKKDLRPDNLFTSDLQLVNEIQTLENFAAKTNMQMTLSISGTAQELNPDVSSLSQLYPVTYSVKLVGKFNDFLDFVQYLENASFISPITGISINYDRVGNQMVANVLAQFYIHRQQ